jgi:DNA-binding PadR family transcriptional regulator
MPATRSRELTTPDLVLLSLLAERPMHGYQANAELERREVRDWAGISRPQVYYSLEKLGRLGLVRASESELPAAGPERSVFETTAKGRVALADALHVRSGQPSVSGRRFSLGSLSPGRRGPQCSDSKSNAAGNFWRTSCHGNRRRYNRSRKKLATGFMRPCGWSAS